ncbi:MAG TPA: hypothetical protein VE442_10685 [Jatrophihabitans sp.]|jgi:D-serine deaminase-like pyridoxal phosphate-dependent protein|nr:hypothetical protein [Jatrophihabitans sp.]
MRKISKKVVVATAAATAIAVGGGIAFAYWSTSGSGSGTGTVASSNGTLVLHGSIAPGLTPGGSETVNFTAENSNSSSLQVGTVHSVVSTTEAVGVTGTCDPSWFTIANVVENQTIPAHTTAPVALVNSGTISMSDESVSQDACKGATITLTLSS